MQSDRWDKDVTELYRAICALESTEECRSFFTDLCTVAELQSLAQRFAVAKLLKEKLTYADIGKQTGASAATISRVNRALLYGEHGYTTILKRLEEQEES